MGPKLALSWGIEMAKTENRKPRNTKPRDRQTAAQGPGHDPCVGPKVREREREREREYSSTWVDLQYTLILLIL